MYLKLVLRAMICLFVPCGVLYANPMPLASNEPVDIASVPSSTHPVVWYRLIQGSVLIDKPPPGSLAPVLMAPIRGSFALRAVAPDPLFANYVVSNLKFHSLNSAPAYTGQGEGTYRLGGEFALLQQMMLVARINNFENLQFDSGLVLPPVSFPQINIELLHIPTLETYSRFALHLVAVPWTDGHQPVIYFSTEESFAATAGPYAGQLISHGDLLSTSGEVIARNAELIRNFSPMPIPPDYGLDGIYLRGLGEMLFSLEQGFWDEQLATWVSHGDLLSDTGTIMQTNRQLLQNFPVTTVSADYDYGLDSIHQPPSSEVVFSIEENFFDDPRDTGVEHGDLLSDTGVIIRKNAQLMANFHPVPSFAPYDHGLDAVHPLATDEIWFSIEESFWDEVLDNYVRHGDLLSDSGRIVMTNADLLARFFGSAHSMPKDYGLDAVWIVFPSGMLKLLAPNGGESLAAGVVFPIRWESQGITGHVLLELSTDGGRNWTTIATVPNTTSFQWEVPRATSNDCLVRISSMTDLTVRDISDAVFTTFQCQISLRADFNDDCYVNWADFSLFAEQWLKCGNPFDPACAGWSQ